MDGSGPSHAGAVDTGPSRLVWRLFSPSFRLISCAVAKDSHRFQLTVHCGDELLTFCHADELESLHARAAEWRARLEEHGYVTATSVRVSDVHPAVRPSEARAAFVGLIECAALLELQQPDAARRLRDRATEGLVALGMSNTELIRAALASSRDVLAKVGPLIEDAALIGSCLALLDRVQATLPEIRSD